MLIVGRFLSTFESTMYQGPELQFLPKVKEDLSLVLIFQDAKNNVSN